MSTPKSRGPLWWLFRAGLVSVVLLLVIFAGSNLFLGTQPGQTFLQKNLNQRTHGISWQVAGASWSPWNGITVKKLTAKFSDTEESEPPLSLLSLSFSKRSSNPTGANFFAGKSSSAK